VETLLISSFITLNIIKLTTLIITVAGIHLVNVNIKLSEIYHKSKIPLLLNSEQLRINRGISLTISEVVLL